MSLLSFIALALGMAAATADGVPRASVLLVGDRQSCLSRYSVDGQDCLSSTRKAERRTVSVTVRRARTCPVAPLARVTPSRGAVAARAPGAAA